MSGRRSIGKKAGRREKLPSWDVDTEKPAKKASESEKPSSWELDTDEPKKDTNESMPSSRELEEEQLVSQETSEQTTEAFEHETLQNEEMENEDHPEERVITRTFSNKDFNHWATDNNANAGEALSHDQGSRKPYVVGKTRLDRQSIGVGALGQRFDALIMKNPDNLGHNQGRIVTAVKDLPPSIPFDLDTFSPLEDADLEPDEEAFLNLDALRPTDSSTLTRYDFEELRDEIADGFNGSQLVVYWRRRKNPDLKPAEASAAYPWLRDLGTWIPVDQDNAYPISREKKMKQQYAHRVMTQIWGLQIQEEVERPGRVTARLATLSYTLITSE